MTVLESIIEHNMTKDSEEVINYFHSNGWIKLLIDSVHNDSQAAYNTYIIIFKIVKVFFLPFSFLLSPFSFLLSHFFFFFFFFVIEHKFQGFFERRRFIITRYGYLRRISKCNWLCVRYWIIGRRQSTNFIFLFFFFF